MNLRVSLLLLSALPAALSAQEVKPPDIPALIEQLAAPKVRLRDEAQALLAELPESIEALTKAADAHPSEEARLRARRLLKDFETNQWMQTAEYRTLIADDAPSTALREVVVSTDGTHMAGAHLKAVDVCRTEDAAHVRKIPRSSNPFHSGVLGVLRAVTFSPDGKLVASSGLSGHVHLDDLDGNRLHTLPAEKTKRTITTRTLPSPAPDNSLSSNAATFTTQEIEEVQEVWGISFSPDAKTVFVFSSAGLAAHRLDGSERRLLALNQVFPEQGCPMAARAYGVSPDGRTAALAIEVMGGTDMVALVNLDDFACIGTWRLPAIPVCVTVNKDGTECLAGLREGGVYRCTAGRDEIAPFHRIGGWITGIGFAPDGGSVMVTASLAATPLRQVAYPSGEVLWSAPAFEKGAEDVVFAGPGRIVLACDDCIRVWTHRDSPYRKPAAK